MGFRLIYVILSAVAGGYERALNLSCIERFVREGSSIFAFNATVCLFVQRRHERIQFTTLILFDEAPNQQSVTSDNPNSREQAHSLTNIHPVGDCANIQFGGRIVRYKKTTSNTNPSSLTDSHSLDGKLLHLPVHPFLMLLLHMFCFRVVLLMRFLSTQ